MDSGMALQACPTFTAKEARSAKLIPEDESLSIDQIILVMDRLCQAETAFYQGHNLLQTVFSCLYVHDIRPLTNVYLQVYIYATLKMCSFVREIISQTDIYEEEDFNGVLFGFHLSDKLEIELLFKMISLAEEELTKKIYKAQGKPGNEGLYFLLVPVMYGLFYDNIGS